MISRQKNAFGQALDERDLASSPKTEDVIINVPDNNVNPKKCRLRISYIFKSMFLCTVLVGIFLAINAHTSTNPSVEEFSKRRRLPSGHDNNVVPDAVEDVGEGPESDDAFPEVDVEVPEVTKEYHQGAVHKLEPEEKVTTEDADEHHNLVLVEVDSVSIPWAHALQTRACVFGDGNNWFDTRVSWGARTCASFTGMSDYVCEDSRSGQKIFTFKNVKRNSILMSMPYYKKNGTFKPESWRDEYLTVERLGKVNGEEVYVGDKEIGKVRIDVERYVREGYKNRAVTLKVCRWCKEMLPTTVTEDSEKPCKHENYMELKCRITAERWYGKPMRNYLNGVIHEDQIAVLAPYCSKKNKWNPWEWARIMPNEDKDAKGNSWYSLKEQPYECYELGSPTPDGDSL